MISLITDITDIPSHPDYLDMALSYDDHSSQSPTLANQHRIKTISAAHISAPHSGSGISYMPLFLRNKDLLHSGPILRCGHLQLHPRFWVQQPRTIWTPSKGSPMIRSGFMHLSDAASPSPATPHHSCTCPLGKQSEPVPWHGYLV